MNVTTYSLVITEPDYLARELGYEFDDYEEARSFVDVLAYIFDCKITAEVWLNGYHTQPAGNC